MWKYLFFLASFMGASDYCLAQKKYDFNLLYEQADSILKYKLGTCIYKKNVKMKSIDVIEEEYDHVYKLPGYIKPFTTTVRNVSFLLTFDFFLDKVKVFEIEIYFDEKGKVSAGGELDYNSTSRNEKETCYLISMQQFRTLENQIKSLHTNSVKNAELAVFNGELSLRTSSFLKNYKILFTYHSLYSGKLLHKGNAQFIP